MTFYMNPKTDKNHKYWLLNIIDSGCNLLHGWPLNGCHQIYRVLRNLQVRHHTLPAPEGYRGACLHLDPGSVNTKITLHLFGSDTENSLLTGNQGLATCQARMMPEVKLNINHSLTQEVGYFFLLCTGHHPFHLIFNAQRQNQLICG